MTVEPPTRPPRVDRHPHESRSHGGHSRDRLSSRPDKIQQQAPHSYEWPEATPKQFTGSIPKNGPKPKRKREKSGEALDEWLALKERVLRRDGTCRAEHLVPDIRCLGRLEVHHLWRVSQGGPDIETNLKAVCVAHHEWIHRNVAAARELDLLRRRGQTGPAT